MTIADFKNKSVKEMNDLLIEKRDELHRLRFQVSDAQLKNVRDIRKLRKEIAQLLTLMKKQA